MATVKIHNAQKLLDKINAATSDETVKAAMAKVAERMKREIHTATFSKLNNEPGILPTSCMDNTHVFASMADRCMCGLVSND